MGSFGVKIGYFFKFGIKDQNKTEKRFSLQNLKLLCFFVTEKNVAHFWGAQAVIWGAQSSIASPWHWACYFLLGRNSRLGRHISRLGTQAMILGARPRNAPLGAQPA